MTVQEVVTLLRANGLQMRIEATEEGTFFWLNDQMVSDPTPTIRVYLRDLEIKGVTANAIIDYLRTE